MFLRHKLGGFLFSAANFSLVIFLGIGFSGCGDSNDNTDLNESARQLSIAQNHILASHEQVALSEQEISRANPSSRRQIESLVARLDEADAEETEAALAELSGMLEQLQASDYASLQAISQGMIALSEAFLTTNRQGNPSSVAAYKKRIGQAKRALNESVKLSKASGSAEDQVGPNLMLGTLHLMIARDMQEQVSDFALQAQSMQIKLGRLTTALITEQAYGTGLPSHFPYEAAANQLGNRLSGDSASTGEPVAMKPQLEQAQQKIQTLSTNIKTTRNELVQYQKMAKKNLRAYLTLLEQAEQTRGDERYALKQQAYALRDGGADGQDGLAYEAKVELLENQLAVLERQLAFSQLQKELLTDMINQVNLSVKELSTSPIIQEIALQAEESQKRVDELVLLINGELENLRAIDSEYRTARMEAVSAYRKSQQAFSQAERAARNDRGSRNYAKHLADVAKEELVGSANSENKKDEDTTEDEAALVASDAVAKQGLWAIDARHYDALAAAMNYLVEAEAIGEEPEKLRQEYLGQAQQARQSISDQEK